MISAWWLLGALLGAFVVGAFFGILLIAIVVGKKDE